MTNSLLMIDLFQQATLCYYLQDFSIFFFLILVYFTRLIKGKKKKLILNLIFHSTLFIKMIIFFLLQVDRSFASLRNTATEFMMKLAMISIPSTRNATKAKMKRILLPAAQINPLETMSEQSLLEFSKSNQFAPFHPH